LSLSAISVYWPVNALNVAIPSRGFPSCKLKTGLRFVLMAYVAYWIIYQFPC
jgi:hypothetical protein